MLVSHIGGQSFDFFVKGSPYAGRQARHALLAADGFIPADIRDDLVLLVSELVSNAVRHAPVGPEQSVQVSVAQLGESLRVEVVDPGTGFTRAATLAKPTTAGGWGLILIDRLASEWGVTRTPAGTCVWAEVAAGA